MASIPSVKPSARIRNVRDGEPLQDSDIENDLTTPKLSNKSKTLTRRPLSTSRLNDVKTSNTLISKKTPATVVSVPGAKVSTTPTSKVVTNPSNRHPTTPTSKTTPGAKSSTPNTKSLLGVKSNGGLTPSILKNGLTPSILTKNNGPTTPTTPRTLDSAKGTRFPPSKSSSTNTPTNRKNHIGVKRSRSTSKGDEILRREGSLSKYLSTDSTNSSSRSSLHTSTPSKSPRTSLARLRSEPLLTGKTYGRVSTNSNDRRSSSKLVDCSPAANAPPQIFLTPESGYMTLSRNESTSPLMFSQSTEESTAVKVGVRIRPMNKREKELPGCHNVIEVNGTQELVVNDEMGRAHSFAYDHCFWSCNPSERIYHPAYATQETVYNTIAKPLLDKALEGYNVCLFAYGQTGSGKSFTMLGDEVSSSQEEMLETAGVIPRFCQDLFQCATQMEASDAGESSHGEQSNNAHVEVQLSYIEIYNERIYDLLGCNGKSVGEKREALRVREHPQNGPYVEGVKCHPVSSFSDLQAWLVLGNRERSIAATGMNDKSSRSHAILTLQLTQTKDESIEGDVMENRKDSIINMVDLAGSERIGTAQSHGDRLKEGVCINKSLLTLGKVITALSESNGRRRPFIPYRESTLTYLLKESLGGNSRTAMIATVSPASDNIEETLSTLRYASQARKILNVNHINEDPKCKLLKELAEEVAKLRAEKLLISPNIQTKLFQFSEEESYECSKKDDDEEEERKKKEEEAVREKELKEENERAIQEREREIALLKEKLCSTQQQFLDQKESWEKRLQNAKDEKKDALNKLGEMGIASQEDEKGPLLVNLCEDPQLSGNLSYKLKTGITTIGHSHSDLILKGLHHSNIHCTINSDGKQLVLTPKHDTETFINGKLVVDPTRLHNDDRLVLAGIYFFRVANPTENFSMGNKNIKGSSNQTSSDFFAAKEELLKIQEEKLRAEAAAQEAVIRAQLEEELCSQRDKFLQKVQADKVQQQTLLAQLEEEQQLRNEMEEEQWRLQENNRILEEEMQKKSNKICDFSFERPTTIPQSNFFAQVENLFDESMQTLNTTLREDPVKKNTSHPLIGSMIKEANQICKKLGKPYEYQQQEMLRRGGVEKQVLIKDTDHNLTATCSIENFIAHLHRLRDIIRGEDDENDMVFETGLSWEKTEDVSRVPGFLSRLQMSFNASSLNSSIFNASLSFHHPVGRVNSGGGRRSSLFSIAEGSCSSPMAPSSGLTSLAGILHQSLVDMTFLDPLAANIHRAFNSTINLYNTIKRIVDHVTEPGATLSEEQVGVQLVKLCLGIQSFVDTVMSVSYMALQSPPSNDLAKVIENLQEGIRNAVPRIKKCSSRLLQGVRTDAESLIEEEGRGLLKEAQNIVENLAKLTVTASLSAPDTITLIPGSILCDKFVCGASSGLEMLVSDAANMAQITAKLLTDMDTNELTSCHRVVSTAKKLTIVLSSFLHKFATLSVAGAWEAAQQQQCSSEELHLRLGRWVGRVEAAADTTSHLTKAIHQIKSYMQEGILCGEPLERAVGELHSRLQEMTSDAGLKPISATVNTSYDHSSTILSISNNSFSSNASMDSSTFLDTLQKLYSKITRTMQNLQWALLENRDAKMHMKLSGVGQWQPGLKPLPAAPVKSALKNTLSNNIVEEKKVRFKVSLSPSTPDSPLSPTSSSSTDDEC